MDGDRVDRRGALTGGYHDSKRSRIQAALSMKKWQERVTSLEQELLTIKNKIQDILFLKIDFFLY